MGLELRDGDRASSATAWWKVVGNATSRGDFAAVEVAIERAWDSPGGPEDRVVVATAAASLSALRGDYVEAEVAFLEALRTSDAARPTRSAAIARITRAECMAVVTPARSIDDARRALADGSTGSRAILHQARMALIAGHRAAGEVDIAIAVGERLLASPLRPLERGRALGGQAMSLIAANERDAAIKALTAAIPIFEQADTPWFLAVTETALARVDPSRRDEMTARARTRAGSYVNDPAWQRILDFENAPELSASNGAPSARELVLALIARGFTSREVADALEVRPCTVESHVRRAMELSGATTRAQLIGSSGPVTSSAHALSPSERALLTLLASGRTTKDVAEQLHLSTRTVTRRLRRLRERFGVATTPALVAAATGEIALVGV